MPYKAGCIALIPFPFTDLSTKKKRPVLMLTAPDAMGDFIAMAITSAPQHSNALVIPVDSLAEGVLPKTSYIRTDQVFTLSSHLLIKPIAQVNTLLLKQAIDQLCNHIETVSDAL